MNKSIEASEFKAKCFALLDEVARYGITLVITKRGKPIADVVPHKKTTKDAFGLLKGRIKIKDDIISSTDIEWEASK